MRSKRTIFILIAAVILVAAAVAAVLLMRSKSAPVYETVPVTRSSLVQTVTASGTANAQNTVNVGTEVSGTIKFIYVDFNSRVHAGQVLARIDPSQFLAQLSQARAALAQAQSQFSASRQTAAGAGFSVNAANAATASSQAGVEKYRAALVLARQTLARDRALLKSGYIAQNQYDADYASAVAAETALRSAQSSVEQNAAQTSQASASALGSLNTADAAAAAIQAAQATVEQDELNLRRTTIRSPVDGTIVARNVSVGQTVAASFQTPTLFTIAQDLSKMEVDIAVGEPDIGNVRPGQAVNFTVLAYPNRVFHGRVSQVRVNPTTIANVVTYTVVVLVENKERSLLPGMTANAAITVAQAPNALVVPTQALAYRPPVRAAKTGRALQVAGTSPWGATASDVSGAVVAGSKGVIFALREGKPQAIPVRVNLVSGTQAAIIPLRSLGRGEAIVVSDDSSKRSQRNNTNPAFGLGRVVR